MCGGEVHLDHSSLGYRNSQHPFGYYTKRICFILSVIWIWIIFGYAGSWSTSNLPSNCHQINTIRSTFGSMCYRVNYNCFSFAAARYSYRVNPLRTTSRELSNDVDGSLLIAFIYFWKRLILEQWIRIHPWIFLSSTTVYFKYIQFHWNFWFHWVNDTKWDLEYIFCFWLEVERVRFRILQ